MALRETDSSLCLSSTFKVSLRHMSSWVATVVYSGIVSFYDLLHIQSQANVSDPAAGFPSHRTSTVLWPFLTRIHSWL